MEAAKPASARTLRPRAQVEKDPAWKASNRKFKSMPEDEQTKLLFAVLHRWPQRLERPVTSAAAEKELRHANMTVMRFNVTWEEVENYRVGAALFHKAATAARDIAGRIKVEILRQGVSATRPWPESLNEDLQKLGPLLKACADWRDVPTKMDARQHTGECVDRVDDDGTPTGKPTDVSHCVLAHRRTEHFRTAFDWCTFVRITEARLRETLAPPHTSNAGHDWPTIEFRLWDHTVTLEVVGDLFVRLAETVGDRPDGRKGKLEGSREVLLAADHLGIPQDRIVEEMLKVYPNAVVRLLKDTRWSNKRSKLSKHLRDFRDGDGRSR